MFRYFLLATLLVLPGCADAPPEMHVDGEIVRHAVQHAQARVDRDRERGEHSK